MSESYSLINKKLVFPKAALFDKIIAKEKILKKGKATAAVRLIFKNEIDRVRCLYEMTSANINLPSSGSVPKILVIRIDAKSSKLSHKTMEAIDNAFGIPLVFEIHNKKRLRYIACYRRRSDNDKTKWVFSDYFESGWINEDAPTVAMPISLNLKSLYHQLIRNLIPKSDNRDISLPELVKNSEKVRRLERETVRLQGRIKREKQFNRKVELNRVLNELKSEIVMANKYFD